MIIECPATLGKELETRFTRICAALVRKTPGSSDTGAVERELMSKEDSDELDSGTEPESTFSAFDSQEIALLYELLALVDPRPDPGIYRNADADGVARDIVELTILVSFADVRPYCNPWVPYVLEEDLLDQP
jgi:hypothetical protein